jgi:hypothetical protein
MRVPLTRFLALVATAVALLMSVPAIAQEASWLDSEPTSWNTPGMALPAAPAVDGNPDPQCTERERSPETAEDDALVAAGWHLFFSYQRGWDVTLVPALAGYDGMCRPLGYQYFVFVGGELAGTVSPEPMNSRTDGSANSVDLVYADSVIAEFRRYAPDDPLCCPSGSTSVTYTIERTPDGPVLSPDSVSSS